MQACFEAMYTSFGTWERYNVRARTASVMKGTSLDAMWPLRGSQGVALMGKKPLSGKRAKNAYALRLKKRILPLPAMTIKPSRVSIPRHNPTRSLEFEEETFSSTPVMSDQMPRTAVMTNKGAHTMAYLLCSIRMRIFFLSVVQKKSRPLTVIVIRPGAMIMKRYGMI